MNKSILPDTPCQITQFLSLFLLVLFLFQILPPASLLLSCLCGTCWFQNLKGTHQSVIHSHHGSSIVKLSTVVWSGEYSYQFTVSEELITIFDNLMCPHDKVQVVTIEEFMDHIYSKGERYSPVILVPSLRSINKFVQSKY